MIRIKNEEPSDLGRGVGYHCRAFKQVGYISEREFDCGMEKGFASKKRREEGEDAVVSLLPTSPSSQLRNLGSLLTASPFLGFSLGS